MKINFTIQSTPAPLFPVHFKSKVDGSVILFFSLEAGVVTHCPRNPKEVGSFDTKWVPCSDIGHWERVSAKSVFED